MKVLHAFNRYMPITQNWAFHLIRAVDECEIYIYAHRYEKSNYFPDGWQFVDFGLGKVLEWHRSLGSSFKDRALKTVLRCFLPYIIQRNKRELRNFIKSQNIDVVHSHFGIFGCEMEEVVKGTNAQHVISFYGFDYEKVPYKNPRYVERYKQLFLSASAFICEGKHGVNTLKRMGCSPEKLHVVHLGQDLERVPFVVRAKAQNKLRLVQVAGITQKKGHYFTIRAFIKALESCPNMTLTIVGSARKAKDKLILEDIHEQISRHKILNNVNFVQRVEFFELHEFLSDYDVFIHPSCYGDDMDCEGGAPVVLLDAQATGMPVISTTHCDIPEEVIDGISGLLSVEKDVDSLARSIERFYSMSLAEYQRFSAAARNHVMKNYDIKESGKSLLTVYKQCKFAK